ncbi:MAG: metallophosphoesterase [Deltaproteobacteria bacterium]|nr:metallophosphoesterase [Deltaproteobacteria bacterium]
MRIQVLSDLHREYRRPCELAHPDVDVVVLAGDIDVGSEGLRWAARTFSRQVIYVPGNHEFYNQDIDALLRRLGREVRRFGHVCVLADAVWVFRGVRFVGTTLWTDFAVFGPDVRQAAMAHCARAMSDFRVIRKGWRRLTPEASALLHTRSLEWLRRVLAEPFSGPTVVISHHIPTRRSVAAEYSRDLLCTAFATDLDELMGRGRVALWIHGHTHRSFRYQLRGTEVVCNPRGYPLPGDRWENPAFQPDLVVHL